MPVQGIRSDNAERVSNRPDNLIQYCAGLNAGVDTGALSIGDLYQEDYRREYDYPSVSFDARNLLSVCLRGGSEKYQECVLQLSHDNFVYSYILIFFTHKIFSNYFSQLL